jgi:DNA-binding transcriptional LysR family regulator
MTRASLFAVGLAFAAGALAQQYKWVDQDGKVRYGDIPPPGVQATPLGRPGSAPAAPAAPPAAAKKDGGTTPLSPEAALRKRQQERQEKDEKSAKERADAEAKRVNCEQSQAFLRSLQSGQRISSTNAAGERVFIDDEQRVKEIERTQRAVNDWCN